MKRTISAPTVFVVSDVPWLWMKRKQETKPKK